MKKSDYPQPGSEAFQQLGPEAQKLARMVHNTTPIRHHKGQRQQGKTANQTLTCFTEA